MTKKTKAVAKKENTEVSTETAQVSGAWGSENISSDNITIPRLMLMQPLSDFVKAKEAEEGEFRESLEKNLVCAAGESFEVIIFGTEKDTIMRYLNGKFQGFEPFTPNYEYQTVDRQTGDITKRDCLMQFYCLLVSDLESGVAFPHMLSFKSTATKNGKALNTLLTKLASVGKPTAARVFTVSTESKTNAKGTWHLPKVAMGRETTTEEMLQAKSWYDMIMVKKAKVNVDNSEFSDVPEMGYTGDANYGSNDLQI